MALVLLYDRSKCETQKTREARQRKIQTQETSGEGSLHQVPAASQGPSLHQANSIVCYTDESKLVDQFDSLIPLDEQSGNS
ncbi:hypothetical protein MBANPS3_005585 [Mucor bainieri]